MLEGPLAALDAIEKATGEREVNVIGYCLGGTLLGATLAYLAAQEGRARRERHLLPALLDFSAAGRARRVHRRGAGREPRAEDERARLPRRLGDGDHLQHAARQRPDLVVRRQQLPDGQGPVPVRPAVLELRLHAHAGERCTASTCATCTSRTCWASPAGSRSAACRSTCPRSRCRLLHLDGRGPHRAVEDHLRGHAAAGGPVRFVLAARATSPASSTRRSAKKYRYWTNDKLPDTPDEWLAGAKQHEGSWWTDWRHWVTPYPGARCRRASRARAS